jgi:hypothetical protein
VKAAAKTPQWTVRSVTPGGLAPLMSIAVDGPTGLYLAEHFISVSASEAESQIRPALQVG